MLQAVDRAGEFTILHYDVCRGHALAQKGENAQVYSFTRDENGNILINGQRPAMGMAPNPKAIAAAVVAGGSKLAKGLLGKSAQHSKHRTNTDLEGSLSTAKSIFRHFTKGKKVTQQDLKNGGVRRISEDKTQIRINPDGSSRLDLPNRGPYPPGKETIHFGP